MSSRLTLGTTQVTGSSTPSRTTAGSSSTQRGGEGTGGIFGNTTGIAASVAMDATQ